ncbi:MAG TPA: transglutaminase domain-containing protein, partial [candidate division Zixibacteria bacterium]|nr:transglutaminase domain-containing protein [candidate division Zixibacteria bacterium]
MSRLSAIFTLFLSIFILSNISAFEYTMDSPDIITAFEKAGDNAPELQKVIDHYKKSGDTLKLTAAYFLIANMDQHSYATYRWFDTSDADVNIDVLAYPNYDSLKIAIGEIEKKRGELDYEKKELFYDLNQITSEFLINQIDYAFKAWTEKPWDKNFDFKQFCRYILPYRGSNEPLEEWRKFFYNKYQYITDSMKNKSDPLEAATIINDDIKTWFGFDPRFYLHPTDQGLSEMIDNKLGRCEDMTNITIYAMRANGLAVTSDYTPYWANSGNNHAWNAIVTADGKVIPFMGAEASPGNYRLSGKVGKVYRKTYDQQKDNLIFQVPEDTEIPPWLKGKNYMDVTADYTDVADVEIIIGDMLLKIERFRPYLCVFNSGEWKPIHWGEKIKETLSGEAVWSFTDMGKNVIY